VQQTRQSDVAAVTCRWDVGFGLAVVRDLRDRRAPARAEELDDFEVNVLAGFVLARASAGLTDGTCAAT
jgi:hypothetical protein